MGLFSRRAEAKAREEEARVAAEERAAAEAADPLAALKRQFAAAAERGRLDEASDTLNRYLAENPGDSGPAEYEAEASLLERAAPVRRALQAQQLDEAAELLENWPLEPPNTSSLGFERMAQLPNLNTAGMLLIGFFSASGVEDHPRYDVLMDTQLANIAKWTRLSSPAPKPGGFFDRVYADIKSKREMSRRTKGA
jgi:hypothetical protein